MLRRYFVSRSGLHHYLNTAKHNYKEFLTGEEVKLKKYFYVLRPILACRWILAEGTPPPMLFSELAEKYLDDSIRNDVSRLLYIKMNTPEVGTGKRIDSLNEYITQSFSEIESEVKALVPEPQNGWEELNRVFLELTEGNF